MNFFKKIFNGISRQFSSKCYILEMGDDFASVLRKQAEIQGVSEVEVIRLAVAYYVYFQSEIKKGNGIVLTDKNDITVTRLDI